MRFPEHELHSPIQHPHQHQQTQLNPSPHPALKPPQTTPNIFPYIKESRHESNQRKQLECLCDAELDETLGRVSDVEVGVFGEHAAEGVVDLGVAAKEKG